MLREILEHTLVGLICLALLGFVGTLLGGELTLLLSCSSALGFLVTRHPRWPRRS